MYVFRTLAIQRNQIAVVVIIIALGILITFSRESTGIIKGSLIYYGLINETRTPDDLREILVPTYQWFGTDSATASEKPGVLAVPGCLGTRAFHREWAEKLAASGFVVLMFDSFHARDISSIERLEGVCEGEEVWGFERAGDVLVALQSLREHPNVDSNSLFLLGWSHGGWSVMDALVLAGNNSVPPMLKSLHTDALSGVVNSFVMYPYCGFGSFARKMGWPVDHRLTMILASQDQNIDPAPCRELAAAESSSSITLVELDATHWFDNPRDYELVPHKFSQKDTGRAMESILEEMDYISQK